MIIEEYKSDGTIIKIDDENIIKNDDKIENDLLSIIVKNMKFNIDNIIK